MLRPALLAVALPGVLLLAACGGGSGAMGSTSSDGPSSGSTSSGSASTAGTSSGGAPEQGRATYYSADGSGACSFDPSPDDLDVAAMDAPEWEGSAVCGACVAVQGPTGSVTVRIVDLCPGCEKGHLDLSQEAFAKIADVSAGNVPITWSVVACDVTGNLAYEYKDGSSQWWTALQVRNSRWAVKSLEWKQNGAWSAIARESYNYFVDASGVGPSAIQVRATAVTGEQIVDTLPAPQSALLVQGSTQFK